MYAGAVCTRWIVIAALAVSFCAGTSYPACSPDIGNSEASSLLINYGESAAGAKRLKTYVSDTELVCRARVGSLQGSNDGLILYAAYKSSSGIAVSSSCYTYLDYYSATTQLHATQIDKAWLDWRAGQTCNLEILHLLKDPAQSVAYNRTIGTMGLARRDVNSNNSLLWSKCTKNSNEIDIRCNIEMQHYNYSTPALLVKKVNNWTQTPTAPGTWRAGNGSFSAAPSSSFSLRLACIESLKQLPLSFCLSLSPSAPHAHVHDSDGLSVGRDYRCL